MPLRCTSSLHGHRNFFINESELKNPDCSQYDDDAAYCKACFLKYWGLSADSEGLKKWNDCTDINGGNRKNLIKRKKRTSKKRPYKKRTSKKRKSKKRKSKKRKSKKK
jgi:hypothetical protein